MGDVGMTKKIHNTSSMKPARKKLRKSLTPAEARLWVLLKNSQVAGRKFRRQHSVGPYVLDFFCPNEKLCIELDGAGHFTEGGNEYDTARTEYLNTLNIRVIRFENKDVFEIRREFWKRYGGVLSDNPPPPFASPLLFSSANPP
jgi:very-short-patch-repair endonuclease